jgi:hypothetical protein
LTPATSIEKLSIRVKFYLTESSHYLFENQQMIVGKEVHYPLFCFLFDKKRITIIHR